MSAMNDWTKIATILRAQGDKLYMPIERPEFEGWPVIQPCAERLKIIEGTEIPFDYTVHRVLDVGCHTGWFSRRCAETKPSWMLTGQRSVIGIDRSLEWIMVARAMNEGHENPPEYRLADWTDEACELPEADMTLALNVLMYAWDGGLEHGWRAYARLAKTAPLLFVELGGQYAVRLPFAAEEAGPILAERGGFETWSLAGRSALDRPIYCFRRGNAYGSLGAHAAAKST